nr:PREDICTED: cell surface glycoprotein CD200 receptor 1-B-like [Latimeria chalumnae]|eukprot:XP_014353119.1 PREDICTED: cell surface glycoprotein CD200 receptor 1-B-like [Latimeria chalumnae]
MKTDNKSIASTCSNSITFRVTQEVELSLQIHSVQLKDEGHYIYECTTAEGTSISNITLSVTVAPQVSLYRDNGVVVCTASHGKPAANISWIPSGKYTTEETVNEDGTVTVNSTYRAGPSPVENPTCVIIHPDHNETISISLSDKSMYHTFHL